MKTATVLASAFSLVAALPNCVGKRASNGTLIVDEAPQYLRPYALRKGAGQAVQVGSQVYRFAVTGNSSDGAFTLMNTNAPDKTGLGVLPHIHKEHYENFYCTKGRVQIWAETNATGEAARVLTQGDYGAVPQNTIHTFQITDPDTQLTGVIQPGGFEALFIALGTDYESPLGSEFVPADIADEAGSDASLITALEAFDVYAQLDFNPRRDIVNGSAGGEANWHNGSNALAADEVTPNFVAKNQGPKYLNTDDGVYRLISPLATGAQTADNFTMGNIVISPLLANQIATTVSYTQPLAFQLEEGQLAVEVDGYDTISLIQGDVIFVPAETSFSYYATAAYTKLLYVSGGGDGIDYQLLSKAESWDYATYPVVAGYTASY
ncbi:RmlC-like cupin domain-containing protein [Truncatella angustata]|uniref:RmlC-like cupin domain-containing protein n=1 Tax=Truncatella angustata TaxID=152316 RepID=A0A9P8RHT3_9PEZI|nr:RmlC-like cupin domain-containing protein [Truncatella angustata]KAH6646107.1 RmlC-like cupin domain-containing protein [Truncatella angustata]